MAHHREKIALRLRGGFGAARLNLRLVLRIGQTRLHDSIAAARSKCRPAQAEHHEAGEHGQYGEGGERADAGAADGADAHVEVPHPHVDADHSDEAPLRVVERCIGAHVAAHRFFHRFFVDGDLMLFEGAAQGRIETYRAAS